MKLNSFLFSASPYGKTKRTKWSEAEKNAIRRCFGEPSTILQLPSLKACQNAIMEYKDLRARRPAQIKTWINNQVKARSRQQATARSKSLQLKRG